MTVTVGCKVRLERDEGYFPPQGTVYVSNSTYFKEQDGGEMKGLWRIEDEDSEGTASKISMSLKVPDGIKVSGEDLVPPGFLYANMRMAEKRDQGLSLYDGRVTVKEDVGSSFLLTPYNGLIAEYKIVGTCEAAPHEDRSGP
mmetsp:Transcript_6707/g.16746  ORF Transcript_6707/g.16746 Transcript_6707/m.16746 type:complete len:142 (+) Transcript_6707:145-570(+)